MGRAPPSVGRNAPGLDDPAVGEDVDAIGLDDAVEAVGDHDQGDA